MFRSADRAFVVVFGLCLAGATLMNLFLTNQAHSALDEGILESGTLAPISRYHVAVVIPDTHDSFFDGLVEGIREEAKEIDAAIQVFPYHGREEDKGEEAFQLCLSARVDGVIYYAEPDDQLARRRSQAWTSNVTLIPIGSQIPSTPGSGFVGSSRLLQGLELANQVTAKLGGSARIGLILTPDVHGPLTEDAIYKGVAAALRSYAGARIVQAVLAQPGSLSGEEAASALLKSDPSINALVCASAPLTEGAAQVVVDQGRVGKVTLVGTDESPAINRLVDKGVILASVVRDSRRMGALAVRAFALSKAGLPSVPPVEVGFTVRTKRVSAP